MNECGASEKQMVDDALLPLLPSVIALVEEQSVTRAAQRLGISQPRMSARLAELRRLLDDPLVVPAAGRRGVIPTVRAVELAQAAKLVLDSLDQALSGVSFDPRTATRTFTIMANDNALLIVAVPLVEAIRSASCGDVRVVLYSYDPARLRNLEYGELDLVLGSRDQLASLPSLMTRTVIRDRFVTAASAGSVERSIDLTEFCARDHVLVSGVGGGFESLLDAELAKLGRKRRVAVSVQSYLVAIELVASSDLLATLPEALLAHRPSKIVIGEPPLSIAPFALTAGWHLRSASDLAHRWLRDLLFSLPALRSPSAANVEH